MRYVLVLFGHLVVVSFVGAFVLRPAPERYVMNAEANGAGFDTWPAWSLDRSKFAFTSSPVSGPERIAR